MTLAAAHDSGNEYPVPPKLPSHEKTSSILTMTTSSQSTLQLLPQQAKDEEIDCPNSHGNTKRKFGWAEVSILL